ncbi:hypothetical protein GJ496_010085 [Pomphorhynchus laevis]|nr:hypothetical protein GJ496_010085 [Pomphorhynchus laevis]
MKQMKASKPERFQFNDVSPRRGRFYKKNQSKVNIEPSVPPGLSGIQQPSQFSQNPQFSQLFPQAEQFPQLPTHFAQNQQFPQTPASNWIPRTNPLFNPNVFLNNYTEVFQPPANNLPPIFQRCVSNATTTQPNILPSSVQQPITIRQDEDIPPRFRPKVKDNQHTGHQVNSAFKGESETIKANSFWNLTSPHFTNMYSRPLNHGVNSFHNLNMIGNCQYQQQPFQMNTIFEDSRKCMSNESYQHQPNRNRISALEDRRCRSTANLSTISDQKYRHNVRNRNSWVRRNNERPAQIPLSAYIAATNQLQKRDSQFASSELALADCCGAPNRDLYSPYKLEEDDVSLFGSGSPLPIERICHSNMSYSSINKGKYEIPDDSTSLDDEVIDETLEKLERELSENDIVKLEDLLKDQADNKNDVKMVYQTKDFMQWARVYFNSQLKKKKDPAILDWVSKNSSTSSLSKLNSESESIDEPEESRTDCSRDVMSDSVDFDDYATEYLRERLNTTLKLPTT